MSHTADCQSPLSSPYLLHYDKRRELTRMFYLRSIRVFVLQFPTLRLVASLPPLVPALLLSVVLAHW